ncbi:hypothetical protein CDAR_260471 [Caerostris darwini]|uniref:Uncharacterized protein n=1 Tax=Caerostris darwini TaxID=1538125 RepID=A0AAV4NPF4_9ARAC|nr:hypothetical protein CDAR_260471 [Caerostris darwini]
MTTEDDETLFRERSAVLIFVWVVFVVAVIYVLGCCMVLLLKRCAWNNSSSTDQISPLPPLAYSQQTSPSYVNFQVNDGLFHPDSSVQQQSRCFDFTGLEHFDAPPNCADVMHQESSVGPVEDSTVHQL